jgi:hypothetical protein
VNELIHLNPLNFGRFENNRSLKGNQIDGLDLVPILYVCYSRFSCARLLTVNHYLHHKRWVRFSDVKSIYTIVLNFNLVEPDLVKIDGLQI